MFYQLLAENSRDYRQYTVEPGCLQFVEPLDDGSHPALKAEFSVQELEDFKRLIEVVWAKIIDLDLPDISDYELTYKGMLEFEQDLVENS